MGASGVITGAQRITRGIPARIAKTRPVQRVLGRTAGGVAKGLTGAERRIRKWETKAAEKGIGGKALSYTLKPFRWAVSPAKLAAPPLMRYAAAKRKISIPKEFEIMSPLEQQRYVEAQMGLSKEDRLQFASYMAEKGTLKNTEEEFIDKTIKEARKLAGNPNFQKEVSNIFKSFPEKMTAKTRVEMTVATKISPKEKEDAKRKLEDEINKLAREISQEARLDPELEKEITNKITPTYKREDVIKDMAAAQLYVKTLKPKDIAKVANPTSLTFIKGMINFGTTPQISTAGKEIGESFVKAYMKEANKKGFAWFEKNKSEVLKYLGKSAAQELGFQLPRKTPPPPSPPEKEKKEVSLQPPTPRGRGGVRKREQPPWGRKGV